MKNFFQNILQYIFISLYNNGVESEVIGMAKLLKKGIAKDNSFIRLVFQCTNGIDTYNEDFYIVEEHNLFLGYGYCVRTPDFYINFKGNKYACFWAGKTIGLNNKCYVVKNK